MSNAPYQLPLVDLAALPFTPANNPVTEGRIITVRIPHDLHKALRVQAREQDTSLNSLCVSRLMAAIPQCPLLVATTAAERDKFVAERTLHVAEVAGA